MNWENARFPGARGLRRRLVEACGPATGLSDLGYRFGDWVEYGRDAAPATVTEVEGRLTEYLDRAAEVGRRWGMATGFGLGVATGFLILAGVALWAVLR